MGKVIQFPGSSQAAARYDHAFEGSAYRATKGLDIAEIAKLARADIKAAIRRGKLPKGLKVSVRIERYSGGKSMDATIKAAPFQVVNAERVQFEREHPTDWYCRTRECPDLLTEKAKQVEEAVKAILMAYNFDDSDSQTDYFHNRFYCTVDYCHGLLDAQRAAVA
jgi:hypothetical protein